MLAYWPWVEADGEDEDNGDAETYLRHAYLRHLQSALFAIHFLSTPAVLRVLHHSCYDVIRVTAGGSGTT